MNNCPLHKISSSDSGSLSLGFKSPISIGGVLFNLERTTLQREHNKHQVFERVPLEVLNLLIPGQIYKQQLMGCLVWSRFSPADSAIEHSHNEHGEGKVPGVTHGDKHHITGILQVPLRAAGRIQHKTNLCPKRG